MEVRIGITGSPREITLDTEMTPEETRRVIEEGLASDSKLVALSDTKGRQVLVPAASLAYVEFGAESGRRVGFVN